MSEIAIGTAASGEILSSVLADLNNGEVDNAIARFSDDFTFRDRGIGLEFTNKKRLAEFFRKTREFFPDSFFQIDSILVKAEHAISEWTLRSTLIEPFYGGTFRKVPVLLHGVSVVRTIKGTIADWSDYYDGLTSRRTALAAHFEEWVEP